MVSHSMCGEKNREKIVPGHVEDGGFDRRSLRSRRALRLAQTRLKFALRWLIFNLREEDTAHDLHQTPYGSRTAIGFA